MHRKSGPAATRAEIHVTCWIEAIAEITEIAIPGPEEILEIQKDEEEELQKEKEKILGQEANERDSPPPWSKG